MTIDFLEIMRGVRLAKGYHKTRGAELCAMEMVAFLEGEKHTDHPSCACPLITGYVIAVNDNLHNRDRNRLLPYLPRVVGTRAGKEVMAERAKALIWCALRELAVTEPDFIRFPLPEKMPARGEIWKQLLLEARMPPRKSAARTVVAAIDHVGEAMCGFPYADPAHSAHFRYRTAAARAIDAVMMMGKARPPETATDWWLAVLGELLQVHPSTAGFSQPLPAPGEAARQLGMVEA